MSEDREISKGIVVNPNRMGGEPTIQGTRIPARMVAAFVSGDKPMDPVAILEGYPSLSYSDITNARMWARREDQWGPRFTLAPPECPECGQRPPPVALGMDGTRRVDGSAI